MSILGGLDLNQVLIVDNQMFSFANNLRNGVPIVDFQGQKQDNELKKLTYYLMQIADSPSLRKTNEATYNFMQLMNSPLERFIKYYTCNSEYTESDFDDDGRSYNSSGQVSADQQFDFFSHIKAEPNLD